MGDFHSLEASIRALPEEKARGDAFERAVLHHVVHDPAVEISAAWLWNDWPGGVGLGRDLGVDIVGTDPEGRLVAIQAKFRSDPARLLRWDDVGTFLAYRPDLFPRRLLVTNALDRNANVKRATAGRSDTDWLYQTDLAASEHWPAVEGRRPTKPRPSLGPAERGVAAVAAAEAIAAVGAGQAHRIDAPSRRRMSLRVAQGSRLGRDRATCNRG